MTLVMSPASIASGSTRAPAALAPLALVGSMTSVCLGASFAHALFPVAGAAGTVTLRIAIAALLLVALRRPWRHPLSRRDARGIALYGLVLGLVRDGEFTLGLDDDLVIAATDRLLVADRPQGR